MPLKIETPREQQRHTVKAHPGPSQRHPRGHATPRLKVLHSLHPSVKKHIRPRCGWLLYIVQVLVVPVDDLVCGQSSQRIRAAPMNRHMRNMWQTSCCLRNPVIKSADWKWPSNHRPSSFPENETTCGRSVTRKRTRSASSGDNFHQSGPHALKEAPTTVQIRHRAIANTQTTG